MRVLYVSHTAHVSGGERSLLDVVRALPSEISAFVASPEGPLTEAVRGLGVPVFDIPGTDGSLRVHPFHTGRGLIAIATAAAATRRLSHRLGADVVHANSIRAGLVTSMATSGGGPPTVVHVRDCLPQGLLSRAALGAMARGADAVLANSEYTAATLSGDASARARVVYSPIDLSRFDPGLVDRKEARSRLGLGDDDLVLVLVAQLTPWKAQDDAIRILARLQRQHPGARLLLAGSAKFVSHATRYDNESYRAWLGKLASALEVEREVVFLGERDDVPELLGAADIAIVPSWEEPFGRSVIEAMAMGCPVVATDVGGPREIVTDGVDGILLPPRDPQRWADAIERLISDADTRAALVAAGRRTVAERFQVQRHVEAIVAAYLEATRSTSAVKRRLNSAVENREA